MTENNQTEMKHPPEPWKTWGVEVRSDPKNTSNLDDSTLVAVTYGDVDGKPRTFTATRICECVNACRGIKDPEAAIKAVREALERAKWEIETSNIDWALYNRGSQDYDPNYKPEFPEAHAKIVAALALLGKEAQP